MRLRVTVRRPGSRALRTRMGGRLYLQCSCSAHMPVADLSDPSEWPANPRRDRAGVIAAPPVLFGAALILGLSLHPMDPARISALPGDAQRSIGVSLILTFPQRCRDACIQPRGNARVALPRNNPLGLHRPISVHPKPRLHRSDTHVRRGSLRGEQLVAAVLPPPALLMIQYGVIRREERYLEEKFGQEYRDYAARVPRWLSWRSRSSNGGHGGD
jgi:hypothetical protein